jgi:hypothetical protein
MKILILIKDQDNVGNIQTFASRMFYLAWKACGRPMGMEVFQDRPQATEREVFNNVLTRGDYPSWIGRDVETYGDYVFGRMMKFGCKKIGDVLEFNDSPFRHDYQGFSGVYPDLKSLLDATTNSCGIPYEVIP